MRVCPPIEGLRKKIYRSFEDTDTFALFSQERVFIISNQSGSFLGTCYALFTGLSNPRSNPNAHRTVNVHDASLTNPNIQNDHNVPNMAKQKKNTRPLIPLEVLFP